MTPNPNLFHCSGIALAAISFCLNCQAEVPVPGSGVGSSAELTITDLQRRACDYFWFEAHPDSGLVKDRAGNLRGDAYTICSVASTGFGLATLPIAVSNGWRGRDEAEKRAEQTLTFALEHLAHEHGWAYHWVDWRTGKRAWESEASTIDGAFLIAGGLVAGEFFGGRTKELAERLYARADFGWMLTDGGEKPDSLLLCHGWKPESGFIRHRWDNFSEHLVLNLLGLGSPTHPIPKECWDAWRRNVGTWEGIETFATAPLFVHQYSHAFVDFREKKDRAGFNYWDTAVAATRIQREFCIAEAKNFAGYGPNSWGLSACDGPDGYKAYGAPPGRAIHDGTLAPWSTLAALPFLPEAADAVQHFRKNHPESWGRYGFSSGFNPGRSWVSTDVIGIDLGAAAALVENGRTGLVWKLFSQSPEIQAAMEKAGFEPDPK